MLSAANKQIGSNQLHSARKPLTMIQKAGFSFNHNFHHPTQYYVNGKRHETDYNTDLYQPHVRAFLNKRWTTRREIPPKVSIMSDMGASYKQTYFQQRLPFSEYQYDQPHMERLYNAQNLNTQFLHSLYFQDYEKNMCAEAMQKRVMNGSVVPMLEKPKHDAIVNKIDEMLEIFYTGDNLTDLELDIERQYLAVKYQKQSAYREKSLSKNKTVWTISDLNRFQDQKNYRMIDFEYFGNSKPEFELFDLDKALEMIPIYQDIKKAGKFKRAMAWLKDVPMFERGSKRCKMQASALITRFMLYQDSWEFVNALDLQDDFHIHNSIANVHLWLIYQRLRDFSSNKFADQLKEELIEGFNAMINSEMEDVQVLRKHKKIEELDNYLYAIRQNLDYHFFIHGISSVTPEFKLDALVWSCIFHEKVPRYSEQVYKTSAYLLQHYNYMRTVSFTDIEKGNFSFSTSRIPVNCRETFTRLNANNVLSPEEFQKEVDSPYNIKKYHYNYRHPEESTEDCLRRTFVNMATKAFFERQDKTVREENLNFDNMTSREREEVMYKMNRQLEEISKTPDADESFFTNLTQDNQLQTQFKLWKQNLSMPLTDQLEERAKRKLQERDDLIVEKQNEDQAFFRKKADGDDIFDIDAQKKRNDRHQAILRQTFAQEEGRTDFDEVKPEHEGDRYKDSIDNLPIKRRQKWRIW